MSCGSHHDLDCEEVLERVYVFIDGELGDADEATIRQHIEECRPCLRTVDIERMLKALVARSCREHAPAELRERVLLRLQEMRVQFQRP